jgi:hypothetical protein
VAGNELIAPSLLSLLPIDSPDGRTHSLQALEHSQRLLG